MILVLSTSRRWLLLLIGFCMFFTACASTEKTQQSMKIGMHIDAVLDFVVEYPLAWHKELRIAYGSREGEVRWTQPDHPATLLRVISMLKNHSALNVEQEIVLLQQNYDGLEIQGNEQVELPAGEAWHISGHTERLALEAYLLSSTDRRYMIALTSAPEDVEGHEEVMERVAGSFRFMQ